MFHEDTLFYFLIPQKRKSDCARSGECMALLPTHLLLNHLAVVGREGAIVDYTIVPYKKRKSKKKRKKIQNLNSLW